MTGERHQNGKYPHIKMVKGKGKGKGKAIAIAILVTDRGDPIRL
jgi:hypothetical protein